MLLYFLFFLIVMMVSLGSMVAGLGPNVGKLFHYGLSWFAKQSRVVRCLCIFLPLCLVGIIFVIIFIVDGLMQHDHTTQPTDSVYRLLPPQSTQVVVLDPGHYPALISGYRRDIGSGLDVILAKSHRFIFGQARDNRGIPFSYFAGRVMTGSLDGTDFPLLDEDFTDFVFIQGDEGAWYWGPDPKLFAVPFDDKDSQEYRSWRMSMTGARFGIWFDFERSVPVDASVVTPAIGDVSFASLRMAGSGELVMSLRLGRKKPVTLPFVRLQSDRARVVGGDEIIFSLRIGGVSLGQRLLSVGLSQFIVNIPGIVEDETRKALLSMLAETLVDSFDFAIAQGTDFPVAIGLRTANPALTMFLRTHYPTLQTIVTTFYPHISVFFTTGGFRADLGEGLLMQGGWRLDGKQSVLWIGGQPFIENQPMYSSSLLLDQQIVGYVNGDVLLPFRTVLGFDDTWVTFFEGKQGLFGLRCDDKIMTVHFLFK